MPVNNNFVLNIAPPKMPPSYRDVHFKLLAGFIEFKFYNYLILWRGGEDGKMKKFHKSFFFREQYQIGSVPNVGGGGGVVDETRQNQLL